MGYPNSVTSAGTARKNREPVQLGDAIAEAMPELAARMRRTAPFGATISIPLSEDNETTLGDLRDLLDLAKKLPDSDLVFAHVPMDKSDHATITIVAGSGDAA